MAKKPLGVLLIHGFSACPENVRPIARHLEGLDLPVSIPALRGHGADTPEAMHGVTWEDWVADGRAALEALLEQAEQAVVVGHSMGGLVTLNLAAEYGAKIDAIVLAAAALLMNNSLAPGRPLHFITPLVARLMKKVDMPPNYADPTLTKNDPNYAWMPAASALQLFDFAKVTRRRLPEVSVPALIMQSRNDTAISPENVKLIYDEISTPVESKRILWFERTEHEMFLDCESEATAGAVAEYIEERLKLKGAEKVKG